MLGSKYHRYSLNRDLEINFDEYLWEQYNLFNVRYVVAPESKKFPEFVRPLQQFGRHRLYQVDTTGYFDLVGSKLAFTGESKDFFLAASSWLASGLPRVKQHPQVTIGRFGRSDEHSVPLSAAIEVIPEADAPKSAARSLSMVISWWPA